MLHKNHFSNLQSLLPAVSYLGVNASIDGAKKFFLSKDAGTSFKFISDMPENLVMCFSQQNADVMYCGYVVLYKSNDGGDVAGISSLIGMEEQSILKFMQTIIMLPHIPNKNKIYIFAMMAVFTNTMRTQTSGLNWSMALPSLNFIKWQYLTLRRPYLLVEIRIMVVISGDLMEIGETQMVVMPCGN